MLIEVSENRFIDSERIIRVEPMTAPTLSIAVYLDDQYQTVLVYTDQEARVLLGGLQHESGYSYNDYIKRQKEKEFAEFAQLKKKEVFAPVKHREVYQYQASWDNDFANSVSAIKQWLGPGDQDAASAPPAGADRNGDEVGPGEEAG